MKNKLRIKDLLCCAFEGGSNYWYEIQDYKEPKNVTVPIMEGHVFPHNDYPLEKDGAVIIKDQTTDKIYTLNLTAIRKGMKAFKENETHHYADWLKEEDDAITGDVFLQCCLFGKSIYG